MIERQSTMAYHPFSRPIFVLPDFKFCSKDVAMKLIEEGHLEEPVLA